MILRLQQGLLDEGVRASLSQLCRWFEVPRRTVYYQPTKATPKVDEQLAVPIKAMIEENPSFGYPLRCIPCVEREQSQIPLWIQPAPCLGEGKTTSSSVTSAMLPTPW